MKLLFDQNISFRILNKINAHYPEALQITILGLENSKDIDIWLYAKQNGFTIITFDSDFIELTNLKGFPPKIIWLRMGNTSTNEIAKILIEKKQWIVDFLNDNESAFLEIM